MILSKNMYQNTKIPEVAILFSIGREILRSSHPMLNNQVTDTGASKPLRTWTEALHFTPIRLCLPRFNPSGQITCHPMSTQSKPHSSKSMPHSPNYGTPKSIILSQEKTIMHVYHRVKPKRIRILLLKSTANSWVIIVVHFDTQLHVHKTEHPPLSFQKKPTKQ